MFVQLIITSFAPRTLFTYFVHKFTSLRFNMASDSERSSTLVDLEVEEENLEFEIQRELHTTGKNEILAIALGLTIPESEIEGKSHLGIVKYVGKFIENMRGLARGDEAKVVEHLKKFRDSIKTIKSSF